MKTVEDSMVALWNYFVQLGWMQELFGQRGPCSTVGRAVWMLKLGRWCFGQIGSATVGGAVWVLELGRFRARTRLERRSLETRIELRRGPRGRVDEIRHTTSLEFYEPNSEG